MKKLIIIALLFVIFSSFAFAEIPLNVYTGSTEGKSVIFTLLDYSYPAEPGKYIDVNVRFFVNGKSDINNLMVEFVDYYPFKLHPSEERIKEFSKLKQGDSFFLNYKVKVDESAVEGDNKLKLRVKYDNNDGMNEFNVYIKTIDPLIDLASVEVEPKIIEQGKEGQILFKIKNNADSFMKNIEVSLDLTDMPIATYGMGTIKKVREVGANGEETLIFKIIADPSARSGLYKIPVHISYYDADGNNYNKSMSFGMMVSSKPTVDLGVDDIKIDTVGKKITISLANRGETQIKFLKAYIEGDGKENYLGNINPDDYETFDVYNDNEEITVRLEYYDSFNQYYMDTKSLNVKYTGKTEVSYSSIIFMAILIILVILVIRGTLKTKSLSSGIAYTIYSLYSFFLDMFRFKEHNWKP